MTPDKPLILIVDDLAKNLQLLGLVLRKNNYRVAAVDNGPAGLDIARTKKPDLILLDVMMPEMDGLEVCRRLKKDPDTASIPVIFLTARTVTPSRTVAEPATCQKFTLAKG